jgi:hypothetical protein
MPPSSPSEAPVAAAEPERLLELIHGCWTTQALCATVELGIADALADRPMDAATLARRAGTDPQATARLLRALVSLGVCESRGTAYGLTSMGRLLAAGPAPSLQGWARLAGRGLWAPWHGLTDSVRTGLGHHARAGKDRFDALDGDAEAAGAFQQAMSELTALIAGPVAAIVDERLVGSGHAVDVGGGQGGLLVAVLASRPGWHGTVFDRAHARAGAERLLHESGLADRVVVVSGNFFDGVPTGDVLLLKSVLHDWDDARAALLLRRCADALSPGGTLLAVERVMPEAPDDLPAHRALCRSDLNMLIGPGGCERTEAQFRALFATAGLSIIGATPAAAGFVVLEATR